MGRRSSAVKTVKEIRRKTRPRHAMVLHPTSPRLVACLASLGLAGCAPPPTKAPAASSVTVAVPAQAGASADASTPLPRGEVSCALEPSVSPVVDPEHGSVLNGELVAESDDHRVQSPVQDGTCQVSLPAGTYHIVLRTSEATLTWPKVVVCVDQSSTIYGIVPARGEPSRLTFTDPIPCGGTNEPPPDSEVGDDEDGLD